MSVKPAASRRRAGLLGRGEGPRPGPPVAGRREHREHAADVPGAAALRHEPAAGPHDAGEVREQRVVVGDPVERRRRQDRVDRRVGQRQRAPQVRDRVGHPIAERRQPRRARPRPSTATHRARSRARRGGARPAAPSRVRSRSRRRARSRRRGAGAGRGRSSPSGSSGGRRGRTRRRPSRAVCARRAAQPTVAGSVDARLLAFPGARVRPPRRPARPQPDAVGQRARQRAAPRTR